MPLFVAFNTTSRRVVGVYSTQALANTKAAGDAALTAHVGGFTNYDVTPGWFLNADNQLVQTTVDGNAAILGKKFRIVQAAKDHARRSIDYMNLEWNVDLTTISLVNNELPYPTISLKQRFLNTRYWIICPVVCIKTGSENPNWSVTELENALEAYFTLVPDNDVDISYWHFNHNDVVWTRYRTTLVGGITASSWFHHEKGQDILSPFKSDLRSSEQWNGSATSTRPTSGSSNALINPEDI